MLAVLELVTAVSRQGLKLNQEKVKILKMGDKKITLLLCGILSVLLGFYFTLQRLMLPAGEPLTGLFRDVIRHVSDGRWTEAQKSAFDLENHWEKHKYLIAFNYGETDYDQLKEAILRIGSGARTQDQAETIGRARVGLELWKNVLRIIPEP
jgi:hypothetical protein